MFAKLADILGAADNYPELQLKPSFAQVPNLLITDAVSPLTPEMDGDVKVFRLTVDEMEWPIDEKLPTVAALGFNAQWPGPTIRATEGDKLRVIFKNNLKETTGVHFHGVEFEDFFEDGVPFVTQKPFAPGEEYAYNFVAEPARVADVPLAPQRDRPGRTRPARRRSWWSPRRRPRTTSSTGSTSGSRTTRWAASRSTGTASRPWCRCSRRRARPSASGS